MHFDTLLKIDPKCSGPCGASHESLGQLMPMYLGLDADGTILGLGPTLKKILGNEGEGENLNRYFEPRRGWHHVLEGAVVDAEADAVVSGRLRVGNWWLEPGKRLHLRMKSHPDILLRGIAVPVHARAQNGALLNLTFGVQVSDAVRLFGLSDADFAPSDLAMELLYLQEAKAAVMGELRALNLRLEDARASAMDKALTDALTGLANRRAFDAALDRAIRTCVAGGAPFALAHLDLDHFKAVNDTMGHAAGDRVLEEVSKILREETRQGDLAARVGGDEFILLLGGPLDPKRITAMGERIIRRLEVPVPFEGQECRISGSIGVVFSMHYNDPEAEAMLADADAALYASKRAGRARCTLHQPE